MTRNRRRTLPAGSARKKIAASVRAVVAGEPGLCAVGGFGVALAGACLVAVAVRGRFIAPEGKMLDAATFCFGVGVFTLTVALLLPLAAYSPAARRSWRRTYFVFAIYGLTLESLQAFRGLDPRFTEAGGQLDVIAGIVFGVTAALNTAVFVVLGLRFFRSDVLADRPTLRAGIRYVAVSVACVAALAQAVLGDAPLQPSAITMLVVAGLSLWAAGASCALLTWHRTAHGTPAAQLTPTGTVTFLFSDIEGSSALWERAGTQMAVALARHDEIVRAAFNRHGGRIFFVGGDGFGVAFARAADALASAIDAQRHLQRAAWPRPIELRVRVGMHTGAADERDGTYFGHPVNVAARLMAAAPGGQIVVSDVTAAAIGDVTGAELIDLGRQRLRGLVDPVGASCVRAEGLACVERSPIDRDAVVGRLPLPIT